MLCRMIVRVHARWVAVCDLGLSAVFIYELDTIHGALIGAADDPRHMRYVGYRSVLLGACTTRQIRLMFCRACCYRLDAGAGCRHATWTADGNTLFVNNELNCTVTIASFDPATGSLLAVETMNTLPDGVPGTRAHHRGNSDIHLHPNGKFLYVGIRSPDPGLIAVFALGPPTYGGDSGPPSLKLVQHESTQGLVPRNFKLVPGEGDAVWLVVSKSLALHTRTSLCAGYRFDAHVPRTKFCPCKRH
jgi:6-phosphogluconolactonase (cycloisomerase 2 family)